MKNIITSIAAVALLSAFAGDLVNVSGASKAAVGGYDTVAFFTDSKSVNGSPLISAEYQGATYYFSSEEHKKLFTEQPEKYAPQCGGFCAYGEFILTGFDEPLQVIPSGFRRRFRQFCESLRHSG